MRNQIIMLSGADGTGKSTISECLKDHFETQGMEVEGLWLRFNHYSAKIINALGRILGKSYQENFSWGKIGYHDYDGVFGYFYILFVFFDHLLFRIFLRSHIMREKPETIKIIDRYILDITADLIVDTGKTDFVLNLFNYFIEKELKIANTFILECPIEVVLERRPDIKDDKKYHLKKSAYEFLANRYKINKLNTAKYSVNENIKQIIE